MMEIPFGVSTCLYNGIMNKIEFTKKQIEFDNRDNSKFSKVIIERDYQVIVEAVDFYNEHCVVSVKYLVDALELLTRDYEKYMSR